MNFVVLIRIFRIKTIFEYTSEKLTGITILRNFRFCCMRDVSSVKLKIMIQIHFVHSSFNYIRVTINTDKNIYLG